MDWTGGKLNRHAKSHAAGRNKLRAQRTSFAQASRNRRNPKTSSHSSPEAIVPLQSKHCLLPETPSRKHKKPLSVCHSPSRQPLSRPEQRFQWDAEIRHLRPDSQKSSARSQPIAAKSFDRSKVNVEVSGANSHLCDAQEIPSMYEMPKSISEMKKRILNQTDWLGLAACRSARIDFAPAGDMAKIGRHRRSTQLKDQDSPTQPPCNDGQQYTTRALIGKRKRCDQEDHSSYQDRGECETGNVSQEQADQPPPRRLLEDSDRRFYVLADDEAYLDTRPKDLLSLEEVREFDNFDAIRKRYVESKVDGHTATVRDGSKIKDTCLVSTAMRSAQSASSSTSGINGTRFLTVGSSPEATLSSPIWPVRCSTSLEDKRNHSRSRLPLPSAQDASKCQLVDPVVLSDLSQFKLPQNLLTPALRQAGIAVQDFAFTSASLKGKHRLHVADAEDFEHAIGHTWQEDLAQVQKEMPLSPKGTGIIKTNKRPAQMLSKGHQSQQNSPGIHPQVRFQLDEVFELESEWISKPGRDASLEEHRKDREPASFSDAMLSPHFIHTVDSDKTTQQQTPVPSSRASSNALHGEFGFLKFGVSESIKQDQYHELRKRSFTKSFLDPRTDGHHSATSLQSQLYSISPTSKRLQRSSRAGDQMSPLNSSSPVQPDHGRSPPAAFSRQRR